MRAIPQSYFLIAFLWSPTAFMVAACGGGGGGSAFPVTMTLTASANTPSEVALSWTAHSSAVIGYDIYRNGSVVFPTHVNGTAVNDTNLVAATHYCYVVYAIDFLLGPVGQSNTACVTSSPTAGWNVVTVGNGSFVSLALDAGNADHVGFRNTGGIQVAASAAGTWSVQNIDTAAGALGHTAIAVDGTGSVYTSYNHTQAGTLQYATNKTGAWVGTTVDTNSGSGSALTLDGAGNAHVSYANNASNNLAYATNGSGTWITTDIFPGYGGGSVQRTSIALDNAGAAHIAYTVGSGVCVIRYAENASGSWSNNTLIDTGARCGTALALNSSNVAHIAYMKSDELHYATNASGSWVSSIVDSMSWVGGTEVSMAVDSTGGIHISYQDSLNADLKYATNTGGIWRQQFVATSGAVGGYSQIRVDSVGKIHIAFTDETAGMVRLATSP